MAPVPSNIKKADSVTSAALIEIARLLARQAARECSERHLEIDDDAPPHPRSEKRS
jgi:hypothetical protein